ncbi:hypothetical protein [Delftia acidovorans]
MNNKLLKKIVKVHFETTINNGLSDLRKYTKKITSHLESDREKIESRRALRQPETDDEKIGNDFFHNISIRLGYKMPVDIFTKSVIISVYTFLEFTLDDFCKTMQMCEKHSISPTDRMGKGIFGSKRYIEKKLKVDLSNANDEWKEIIKLNKIRNFLVHSNGVARQDDVEGRKKIEKIISKTFGVELEQEHIKVSTTYIAHAIDVIEKFLKKVSNQYCNETV